MRRPELLAVIFCVLLGAGLRLAFVGPAFLFGDEFHSLQEIEGGYKAILSRFSPTGSGMALPLLQRILCDLFGVNHWSLRAPAWLAGLATLGLLPWIAWRRHGAGAAAVAAAIAAASPLLVFYSHFGRVYAGVALFGLLLWDRLELAVATVRPGARQLAGLGLLTALLPWLHPTALGFVLPVYAGACLQLAFAERRRGDALRLVATLAAAGALCLALHAPAWKSLWLFVSSKTAHEYLGHFAFWDVASLLAGSRPAAWILAAGLAASLAGLFAARGWRALPLAMACAGPPLVVAAVQPYGDAYAYARYVLAGVPPACLALAWGITWLAGALPWRPAARRACELACGGLLAALLFAFGPYGWPRTPDGPYANTYLTMFPLAPFDQAWPREPDFYRELAARPAAERARLRILEAPALVTRARQLYRSYYLQHGIETKLVVFPSELSQRPAGPYVSLAEPDWRERADADYLVLHLDIESEVVRYWNFVYEQAYRERSEPWIAALMERQRAFGGPLPPASEALVERLRTQLGEPVSRDRVLAVWKLR